MYLSNELWHFSFLAYVRHQPPQVLVTVQVWIYGLADVYKRQVFDHDCREGICGMCSLYINGHPHGPATGATTCQIYMRRFNDGDTITVEPWRSAGFPVIKDLMVDRTAYDKIMQAGGYVSVRTGAPQDANAILIPKPVADEAMDAASCIGCGACVAAVSYTHLPI